MRSRRTVEHRANGRTACSCGAAFGKPGKLRSHIALYQPEQPAAGFAPRTPDAHKKKRAGAGTKR